MADGSLIFDTGIDRSGFEKDTKALTSAAAAAATTVTAAFTVSAAAAAKVGAAFTASMSQVAATMSIDRMSKNYDLLADSAEAMGAVTKFSASRSADALNYLALAGYDAQKAVAALPSVLRVATAGSMDLAYSSDMITDSMSALGLSVDELDSFADKLAKTSQKSNTSIAQLGEAILTVGGTAKTLSGGVTELNTMLGLIADNGIKGAEGGTALRNIILSLSAPTDTAAAAMANLNVTAFDSSGKMRSLADVFADFNAALEPLTEQQRTQALSEIFNKVDLKAVNALLGTSAERFAELTGYISDCDGAAAQMAKTMSDNLTGDMDNLSSALEGLGITAFGKFEKPLRTAVQEVTEVISELNKSLDGEAGEKLADLAEKVGNLAVRTAELAVDKGIPMLIDGLEWVCDNSSELATAAKSAAAMVIAYKGLSAASTAATSVKSVATAFSAAAASQGALSAAMSACPWVAVAALAIGAATAIASYIDEQRQWIGYEGEIKESFNEANAEIAKQIGYLDELGKTDPYAAYKESAEGLDDTANKIEAANDRLAELYNKRQQLNIVRDNASDVSDPFLMEDLNAQLDAVEQEIKGLEEQLTVLGSLNMIQSRFAEEYSSSYSRAVEAAEDYKQKVIEMNQSGKTTMDIINDIMSRRNSEGLSTDFGSVTDSTDALQEQWEKLSHDYAMGVISSDEELYNKRLTLLRRYGDESNAEHWNYYEALADYEQSQNADSISRTKAALRSQLDATKSSLSDMVSEYDNAMSELEDNMQGYKNRLLSVGDIFSVSETEIGSKKVKQYTIENINEQMSAMRKYHSYIKQLKASGASDGLLSELTSLDFTDGAQFGKYLTSLGGEEFDKINNYYKEREQLADEMSRELYADEAEQINDALMSAVDSALAELPVQAQEAGRQMLQGIIAGMDISGDNLSEAVTSFADSFAELYNAAVEEIDLEHGFAIALGGMDVYSMGQELARDFASGFNEELAKSRAEIMVQQTVTADSLSSGATASAASQQPKNDGRITVETTNNITVAVDGDAVTKTVEKRLTEKDWRTG